MTTYSSDIVDLHPNETIILSPNNRTIKIPGNHLWVINEYCCGGDLMRLLKLDTKLDQEQSLKFARDVCEGRRNIIQNSISIQT
jgi:hypothetical protein